MSNPVVQVARQPMRHAAGAFRHRYDLRETQSMDYTKDFIQSIQDKNSAFTAFLHQHKPQFFYASELIKLVINHFICKHMQIIPR